MIQIKETKKADTRTLKPGDTLSPEIVEHETKLHIEAVNKCGEYICQLIKEQFKKHDHTKLGEHLEDFTEALSTGFKENNFKKLDWWKDVHLTERHHLNDSVPEDVNLVDVLEMVCDCVSAGLARSGTVYTVSIPDEVLKKAFTNTVELLKKNIEVVPNEPDETESPIAKKLGL